MIVLAVALVIFGALTAKSLLTVKDSALLASNSVAALKADIAADDYNAAAQDAETLRNSVKRIKSELNDPVINAIGSLPCFSHDFAIIKTLVGSADSMCTDTLVPLVQALEKYPLSSMIENGTINATNVNGLLDAVETCIPSMKASVNEIRDLPDFDNALLQSYVGKLTDKIDPYLDSFDSYIDFIPLARSLIGDGNKSYVLVSQNLAETRSRGGFPGASGEITMTNGKLAVGQFASAQENLAGIDSNITEEEYRLFGVEAGVSSAMDLGHNPDFPTVAAHWLAAYNANTGKSDTALVALTPAVVQKVLAITGPMTLSNGQVLDGTNAVAYLSHGIYWQYFTSGDSEEAAAMTDALFQEAAQGAFNSLMNNLDKSKMLKFINLMIDSIQDKSLLLYMNDAAKEKTILQADAGGALNKDASNPSVGVYFNLREASKLGWYVDMTTEIGPATNTGDGKVAYRVTTKVTNTLTNAELAAAPVVSDYLLNDDGDIKPTIYLYAPAGGIIKDVVADNGATPLYSTYQGFTLAWFSMVSIKPEQSMTITYTVTCDAGAATPTVDTTPLLTQYR